MKVFLIKIFEFILKDELIIFIDESTKNYYLNLEMKN